MNTERTPLFLMANLGAEVSRIISAKERGEDDLAKSALLRAEKMLSEIRTFPEMAPREIEISPLEQTIRSIIEPNPGIAVSPYHLKNYFLPFVSRFAL